MAFSSRNWLLLLASARALAPSSQWRPLPDVAPSDDRFVTTRRGAAAALGAATLGAKRAFAAGTRRVATVQSWPRIPVWPTWGGGRVIPMSLDARRADPFLLVAHHKHWFDPRDPLRGPFRAVGGALGLPYVDVEGFSMHPHRGFDILTYVLDGSDGFRHRDSLGGERTYRGGSAQFMRAGRGAMHEEFWETRDDRRTSVELFQVWINLPRRRKEKKTFFSRARSEGRRGRRARRRPARSPP